MKQHVGQKLLDELPFDGKLDLLDAENDLFIAIDKLDDAKVAARQARVDLDEAHDRLAAADKELSHAKTNDAKEIAKLTITESDEHIAYLELARAAARAEVDAAEVGLVAARARLERARCEIVRRYKTPGSEKLDPKEFDAQVARLEKVAKEAAGQAKARRAVAEAERAKWFEKRRALADRTGGARGSPWVE